MVKILLNNRHDVIILTFQLTLVWSITDIQQSLFLNIPNYALTHTRIYIYIYIYWFNDIIDEKLTGNNLHWPCRHYTNLDIYATYLARYSARFINKHTTLQCVCVCVCVWYPSKLGIYIYACVSDIYMFISLSLYLSLSLYIYIYIHLCVWYLSVYIHVCVCIWYLSIYLSMCMWYL